MGASPERNGLGPGEAANWLGQAGLPTPSKASP